MQILTNISLVDYNTFKVDTTAETLILIEESYDFDIILKDKTYAKQNKFLLGAGSNLLLTHPISGLTIKNNQFDIRILEENNEFAIIEAESGLEWHKLVQFCLDNHFYGLENLALIPGLVGAAPVQNIGAYGVEQSKYFHSLDCIDLSSGRKIQFLKNDCAFDYRYSIFKQEHYKNYFITKVRYKLSKTFKPQINYKDLKIFFEGKSSISAKNVFDAIIEIRNNKLPDYKELPNAGSFFKNPVVTHKQMSELLSVEPTIVNYPIHYNSYKISAANLIEKAGLKGYRQNNVGISTKHSLIIVNFGNATGKEIYDFSNYVIYVVKEKYYIALEPEVIII